ncbi:MAG: SH3 domain-containing protein [Aestuariivirga sp.]
MTSICSFFRIAIVCAIGLAAQSALAEADSFKVRFKPGAESARYTGSIQGYDDDTYIVDARRGQEMTVSLRTSNPQAYFNILPPGSDVAIYNGSIEGNRYTGVLPRSGKYRIVVYMMRAAARRDEVADYRLSVAIPAEEQDTPSGDFADGNAGGPDFWVVSGVSSNDRLNIRTGPSANAGIVGRVRNGTVMRNLGCERSNGSRWCRVSVRGESSLRGWVNGRFLQEY